MQKGRHLQERVPPDLGEQLERLGQQDARVHVNGGEGVGKGADDERLDVVGARVRCLHVEVLQPEERVVCTILASSASPLHTGSLNTKASSSMGRRTGSNVVTPDRGGVAIAYAVWLLQLLQLLTVRVQVSSKVRLATYSARC